VYWYLSAVPVGSTGFRVRSRILGALSGDGNTAVVGGPYDNSDPNSGIGAVGSQVSEGQSVALSGDGNTAIVGGPADNSDVGAAWVFTRSGGVWTQQGRNLVGTGAAVRNAGQGQTVAPAGWKQPPLPTRSSQSPGFSYVLL
jgi:hypothetical protein